jgi:hypothetical protein
MPFVYDLTSEDAEDEIAPPRANQFVYLPAPEYYPARQPVRFSILPVEPSEPEVPIASASQPNQVRRRNLLDLFRGRQAQSDPAPQPVSPEERRRRRELRRERRVQQLFSILVPALKAAGVRRVYCRYDGGNDEGFTWVDRYKAEDGARIDDSAVGRRLLDMKVDDELSAAKLMNREGWPADREAEAMARSVGSILSHEWGSALLGESFGTGEYLMYGAFAADLEECTVTDDPRADPVVENIEIRG